MHEHTEQLRRIRSFAFSPRFTSIALRACVSLRRIVPIYRRMVSVQELIIQGRRDHSLKGGCEQSFHVMSALTTSVLAERRRQPDELARTAITSERFRIRSTTARILVSGGSMIWTYNRGALPRCALIPSL